MTATTKFDPELLAAIEGWKKLSHTRLAIAAQAMFALATHDDSPQWIRNAAECIVQDIRKEQGLD